MTSWLIFIVAAYLLGSIPFGFYIGLAKGVDVRQHGSKNVGATNVGRLLGRRWGVLCFVLDALKGALPVLAAGWWHELLARDVSRMSEAELWWWLAVAGSAVIGHMYSIFLLFRGGKGVATGFGALLAMWPVLTFPALAAVVVWATVLRLKHYMSLASISAAVSLPVWYLLSITPRDFDQQPFSSVLSAWRDGSPPLIVTTAIALAVIYKHRSNIARLRAGKEMKVGLGNVPTPPRVGESGP